MKALQLPETVMTKLQSMALQVSKMYTEKDLLQATGPISMSGNCKGCSGTCEGSCSGNCDGVCLIQ